MRKLLTICLVISFVTLLVISTAYAKSVSDVTEVYPTGDPTLDVSNVQDAINQGGTVFLKATDLAGNSTAFNFGDEGSVYITTDVEIVGEEGATILGGHYVIWCQEPVNLTVKGIHFEDAKGFAIGVFKSTGLEVAGCTIVNVKNDLWYPPWPYDPPLTHAVAIAMNTLGMGPTSDITGEVVIKDNYINPNVQLDPDYSAQINVGINVGGMEAKLDISGNEVRNCNLFGILVEGNLGMTTISNNIIHTGERQLPYTSGNGITIGGYRSYWYDLYQGSTSIIRNDVYCVNPIADGIVIDSYYQSEDATYIIKHNKVTMENSRYGALTCYDGVKNSVWQNNKVEGTMRWAIGVVSFSEYIAENNTFIGNVIAKADTEIDIFLDEGANYNTVVGRSGTVVDLGIGNIITGFTKKGLNAELGQRIRDALARKREMMGKF